MRAPTRYESASRRCAGVHQDQYRRVLARLRVHSVPQNEEGVIIQLGRNLAHRFGRDQAVVATKALGTRILAGKCQLLGKHGALLHRAYRDQRQDPGSPGESGFHLYA
ncbi:MAG: hypothetical protein ACREYE_23495 [Gammaproteobacteria bacterium]